VHGTPKRFTKKLIFSFLPGPRPGIFMSDQTLNIVSFWLSNAAVVQKMNVLSYSIDCYGVPEKKP
jgi:hypothetical protein